jgi:tRNA threonylcarbamoyladenosine biosynthesis protein TsaE
MTTSVFPICRTTTSAEATEALGESLGRASTGGEVIALVGPLGAGKTCLVRGLARGLGIPSEEVTSPTFILVHEYDGRLPMVHVDLFRVEAAEALHELGLEEYLGSAAMTVIEWADKAPTLLPRNHLRITMEHLGGDRRLITLSPFGNRYEGLVRQIVRGYQPRSPVENP